MYLILYTQSSVKRPYTSLLMHIISCYSLFFFSLVYGFHTLLGQMDGEKAALLPQWMVKEPVMVTVVKAGVSMFWGAMKVVKSRLLHCHRHGCNVHSWKVKVGIGICL